MTAEIHGQIHGPSPYPNRTAAARGMTPFANRSRRLRGEPVDQDHGAAAARSRVHCPYLSHGLIRDPRILDPNRGLNPYLSGNRFARAGRILGGVTDRSPGFRRHRLRTGGRAGPRAGARQ
jgi:hypothetical protein